MGQTVAPIYETSYLGGPSGHLFKDTDGKQRTKKANLNATTDPTSLDGVSSGYSIGSRWINISTDKVFECVDTTILAAVWKDLSSTSNPGGSSGQFQINNAGLFDGISGSNFSLGVATLPNLAITDLTTTRVPVAGASGRLQDFSSLTFNSGTGNLSATQFNSVPITALGLTSNFLNAAGTYSTPPNTIPAGVPGSGTELQYRVSATTLGVVTGSSVSGANVGLTGTLDLNMGFTPARLNAKGSVYIASEVANQGATWITQAGTLGASIISQYNGTGTLKNLFSANGDSYIQGGNFGIGTGSPGALLQVGGLTVSPVASPTQIRLDGSFANSETPSNQQMKLNLLNASSTEAYGFAVSSNSGIWHHVGNNGGSIGYHAFAIGGTERFRIHASGISIVGNIGLSVQNPQNRIDMSLTPNTFGVHVGGVITQDQWIGVSFGYNLADSTQYRKSGIVFKRTDVDFGRGDLLILNNNTADTSQAGLVHAVAVFRAGGNIGLNQSIPTAHLHQDIPAATTVGHRVDGHASQGSTNLAEWNPSGVTAGTRARITSDGYLSSPTVIGATSFDTVSGGATTFSINGVSAIKLDNSSTVGETRLQVFDVDTGILKRVRSAAAPAVGSKLLYVDP